MTIFDKYIYCITLMRTNKSETCVFDFKHVSVIRKENTFVKNSIVCLIDQNIDIIISSQSPPQQYPPTPFQNRSSSTFLENIQHTLKIQNIVTFERFSKVTEHTMKFHKGKEKIMKKMNQHGWGSNPRGHTSIGS